MIESSPLILGIVLALSERTPQLFIAQCFILREQPVPTLVELGLDFDSVHGAP